MTDFLYKLYSLLEDLGQFGDAIFNKEVRKLLSVPFIVMFFIGITHYNLFPFSQGGKQPESETFIAFYMFFALFSVVPTAFKAILSLFGSAVEEVADAAMGLVYIMMIGGFLFVFGTHIPVMATADSINLTLRVIGLALLSFGTLIALLSVVNGIVLLFKKEHVGTALASTLLFAVILSPAGWAAYNEVAFQYRSATYVPAEINTQVDKQMIVLKKRFIEENKRDYTDSEYYAIRDQLLAQMVDADKKEKAERLQILKEKYGGADPTTMLSYNKNDLDRLKKEAREKRDAWKRWQVWATFR